jgi:aryl-alcohol dehydrogenase-like predicted oxidoreductase
MVMKRILGHSGIEVSALGMGCWAIGGEWQLGDLQAGWGKVDDDESLRAIEHAIANGITFFDTAATYGAGHSESIVGKALARYRDHVIIATKFGFQVNEATKYVTRYENDQDVVKNVRAECEASLQRLKIDYIDLYQFHVWDYPIELASFVREALESLVTEGKIRYYGWSTDSVEASQVFAEGKHCIAIQHDLNVVKDASEMVRFCEKQNLASVNRSPLARGALTGKYNKETVFAENDVRCEPWSYETFFVPVLAQLDDLRDILTSGGRTLTQGALAWIWARSECTIPIPGIRTVKQVTENAGAMQLGPLSKEQMHQIDEILHGHV